MNRFRCETDIRLFWTIYCFNPTDSIVSDLRETDGFFLELLRFRCGSSVRMFRNS